MFLIFVSIFLKYVNNIEFFLLQYSVFSVRMVWPRKSSAT